MALSSLPLSYCTNVHPGRSIAEVEQGLDRYTVPVAHNVGTPLAAGLWLANPVVAEFRKSLEEISRFADGLVRRGLTCHTLNAFPFGDFHSPRVKEKVYIPDWSHIDRLQYTLGCAEFLAVLLPEGVDGSISTLPLGFKEFSHPPDFLDQAADQLLRAARELHTLHNRTGRMIRLAIEPEPFCLLETTPEAISFFDRLFSRAADAGRETLEIAKSYLGLCYDVCHQAVEYEDIPASIAAIDKAGIRINKVHITCAIQLDHPAANVEGRRALARYVEPRYLHQTMARGDSGRILRVVDLVESLAVEPPAEFLAADSWRVHFHVPVDAEQLGPLGTTRSELKQAIAAIAKVSYAPHLEVETYTWEVLPGGSPTNLIEGLTRELTATQALISVS